jgi:hypothetical protein
MKSTAAIFLFLMMVASILWSCKPKSSSHHEMIKLLKQQRERYDHFENYYASQSQVRHFDSLIRSTDSDQDKMRYTYNKCYALIALGREDEAIQLLEEQVAKIDREGINGMNNLKVQLALAYLRSGERVNCITNHNSETCILPIKDAGIHIIQDGSLNAIRMYKELLTLYPENMEYLWLLNIAYMTIGEYPTEVPHSWLIPGLDPVSESTNAESQIYPFEDIASSVGLDVNNMAGGTIVDDFNNDDYLDIITSSWDIDEALHFFKNNGDGTFSEVNEKSNLSELTGGLNLVQMDYNNDGFKDIFVLRGAWLRGQYGTQPNSLLKNNGDGTFEDVTIESGLLSFHPTQTATWNDFNNDGWVDVFVGNETWQGNAASGEHPCELYLNNKNGTFRNVAEKAKCNVRGFIKGVVSGDYNNDGWKDLFITNLAGEQYLLKNIGIKDGVPEFENVTKAAKLSNGVDGRTFPSWFWDYDNDGFLDILVGDFTFDRPISSYAAEEALEKFDGQSGIIHLYRNNGNETFTNVSEDVGTNKTAFAMSGNFGDIDNDGFLDFYLGTGNPELESIVPNKMFKNVDGKRFVDVTAQARVGHLQKGHGIAFADLDHDGDQDIYIEMGGAYKGDSFHNAFYLNPGQNPENNWITLDLVAEDNKNIIGTTIRISFQENGTRRDVFRDVNSGGSFGASPLRKEIGIGKAKVIDEIEIRWHPGKESQVFRNVQPNQFLRIRQGKDQLEKIPVKTLEFSSMAHHEHH